ncbi:hypothetical protein E3N88_22696 [Mikania micrantha]|uniref:CCHC-type domain-containing protein n=1 Tax=Mikania micrantha TaxID=192012 RepID=A0A5N6NDU8_9ASTR|nr:hypothetical protein E3N88_22696 [Mikania micrantha]
MAEPTGAVPTQPTPIPTFKGEGYDFWSIRMKTILRLRDLWDLVESGINVGDTDQARLKATQKKDAHAMAIIQQAVHDQLFSRIAAANSAKETWEILKMEYQGDDQVKAIKLQGLMRDFENLCMMDDETVGDYFSRVMTIVSQRRSYGEPVTDQAIVEKILRSLTPRFDYIVPSIEVSNDLTRLTPIRLMGSLKSQEARLNSRTNGQPERSEEQALQVIQEPSRTSASFRGRCRSAGRGRYSERNRGPQCHICNRFGHVKKDCWFNEENQAQIAEETPREQGVHEEPHLFFAQAPIVNPNELDNLALVASTKNERNNSHLWFLDFGCSNHMTGHKENFTDLDETFKLEDLGCDQELPTTIFCDNKSAINLSRNPIMHSRSKHIELKHHFIRDLVKQNVIQLEFCGTNDQFADMLTKAISKEKFIQFRRSVGMQRYVSMNDPFLNLLCFNNNDEDEGDLNSVEHSSYSEKDYDKDVEDDKDYKDEGVLYPCYNPNIYWKLEKKKAQGEEKETILRRRRKTRRLELKEK